MPNLMCNLSSDINNTPKPNTLRLKDRSSQWGASHKDIWDHRVISGYRGDVDGGGRPVARSPRVHPEGGGGGATRRLRFPCVAKERRRGEAQNGSVRPPRAASRRKREPPSVANRGEEGGDT